MFHVSIEPVYHALLVTSNSSRRHGNEVCHRQGRVICWSKFNGTIRGRRVLLHFLIRVLILVFLFIFLFLLGHIGFIRSSLTCRQLLLKSAYASLEEHSTMCHDTGRMKQPAAGKKRETLCTEWSCQRIRPQFRIPRHTHRQCQSTADSNRVVALIDAFVEFPWPRPLSPVTVFRHSNGAQSMRRAS